MGATRLAVAAAAAWLSGAALAEDTFRAEAGLSATRLKTENQRTDIVGLDGTWYFDNLPLQPKDHPLDEAAFVERVGFLNAGASWISSDIDNEQRLGNGSTFSATADIRQPGAFWFLTATAGAADNGKFRAASSDIQTKVKFYSLDLGAYVAKTTVVSLVWSESKLDTTISGPAPSTSTDKFTTIGVSGRHLAYLPGGDYLALTAEASQIKHEQPTAPTAKNNDFSVLATYYPEKTVGLSLGVATNRGDDTFSEGETYTAGAKVFVTPLFSATLNYQHFNSKASNGDVDTVMLRGALRF